jgi:hypothetical protein
VSFEPLSQTFQRSSDTRGCPAGSVGTFNFDARLTHLGGAPFFAVVQLQVGTQVGTVSGGNRLLVDGRALGVGGVFHVPREDGFADGTLSPGERVDVPFTVCQKTSERFRLKVGVLARLGER